LLPYSADSAADAHNALSDWTTTGWPTTVW